MFERVVYILQYVASYQQRCTLVLEGATFEWRDGTFECTARPAAPTGGAALPLSIYARFPAILRRQHVMHNLRPNRREAMGVGLLAGLGLADLLALRARAAVRPVAPAQIGRAHV